MLGAPENTPSPDASPSSNGRRASASRAPSPPASGPATPRADTVSGCWDPPPRHGSRCRCWVGYERGPLLAFSPSPPPNRTGYLSPHPALRFPCLFHFGLFCLSLG